MSRFDIDYDGTEWDFVRWQGAKRQAFQSQYGKERLRELEAALLALPRQRLIKGRLIEPFEPSTGWAPIEEVAKAKPGDVCAIGAFCAYKMGAGDIQRGLQRFLESRLPDWDYASHSDTTEAGLDAGMRYSMAWEIGYLNDETFHDDTAEERYTNTLEWVRTAIMHGAPRQSWS